MTILTFPNPHGLSAELAPLPADAAAALARHAAVARRRLSLHAVADDLETVPTPWHADILAATIAGARMAGAYISEPMPLENTMSTHHLCRVNCGGTGCYAPRTASRMAMTPADTPRRPYIPAGCDQQGRMPSGCRATPWPYMEHSRPGPLTEAELDRANEAKALAQMPLPELLLRKGAMVKHPAPTLWQRIRRAWMAWRLERLGPRL